MNLIFEQTIDDVVAVGIFNKQNISNIRKVVKLIPLVAPLAMLIFLLALKFYYFYFYDELFEFPKELAVLCGLLIVFILAIRSDFFYAWLLKVIYHRKGFASWYGQRNIAISEADLHVKTVNSETRYNWDSILKLGRTKKHIFLFTSKVEAIIIPKRIFLLPEEEHELMSLIERKLSKPR